MRFFQYQATDSYGRVTEGTIRAASPEAANAALQQSGFRTISVRDASAATTVSTAPRAVAPPAATAVRTVPRVSPVSPPRPVTPPAATPIQIQAPAPKPTVKTRFGRDKDLYFLFGQFASLFNAGMNPGQMFAHLSDRGPRRYRPALRELSQRTMESGRISDALERYPYLFPPDVVGCVRVGEHSGTLTEVAQNIATHTYSAHRLKLRMTVMFAYFIILCSIFPMSYGVIQGSLASMAEQDKAGGSLPPVPTLMKNIAPQLAHQIPLAIAAGIGAALFLIGWHTMPLRTVRHQLSMRFPALAGRSWAEALSRLTWANGMLSRGGMPPQQAFLLAVDTIPNMWIRNRFRESALQARENESVSSIFRRTGLLPMEYGDILETGEISGNVPGAFEQIHRAASGAFEDKDRRAAFWLTFIIYVFLGLTTLFMMIVLMRAYYGGVQTMFLNTDG